MRQVKGKASESGVRAAMLFDTFFISGGKIGLTLEMNAEALAKAIGAEFADLTL